MIILKTDLNKITYTLWDSVLCTNQHNNTGKLS